VIRICFCLSIESYHDPNYLKVSIDFHHFKSVSMKLFGRAEDLTVDNNSISNPEANAYLFSFIIKP